MNLFGRIPIQIRRAAVNYMDDLFPEGTLVFAYTRREALIDKVQFEADPLLVAEAGIKIPVYMTSRVKFRYVEFVKENIGQDETGRLMDILTMFRYNAKYFHSEQRQMTIEFLCQFHDSQTWLPNEKRTSFSPIHRTVSLTAEIGPKDIDDPSAAITLMIPGED